MIGQRVATLREAQGLSQGKLAKRAGVRQGTISKIERGQRLNPGVTTLQKLAIALGVTLTDLTNDKAA